MRSGNNCELDLAGALPLGVLATVTYDEKTVDLREGDHFAHSTDGLLEARKATGEIFSFERLDSLFATSPDAARVTEAAVDFSQDGDMTVLTLTRLFAANDRPSNWARQRWLLTSHPATQCATSQPVAIRALQSGIGECVALRIVRF